MGSADGISALVVVEVLGAGQEDGCHYFVANVAGRVGVVCVLQFFLLVSEVFFFAEEGVGSAFCGGGWDEGSQCGAEAGKSAAIRWLLRTVLAGGLEGGFESGGDVAGVQLGPFIVVGLPERFTLERREVAKTGWHGISDVGSLCARLRGEVWARRERRVEGERRATGGAVEVFLSKQWCDFGAVLCLRLSDVEIG